MTMPPTQSIAASSRRSRLAPVLLALIVLLAGPAAARGDAVTVAMVDALRSDLARTPELTDEQRQQAGQELDRAQGYLADIDTLHARLDDLRAEVAAMPAQAEVLRRHLRGDLDADLRAWLGRLPANADVTTLERLLEVERGTLVGLHADIERVSSEQARSLSEPVQSSQAQAELRQRIDELSLAIGADPDSPDVLVQARQLRRAAELRLRRTELELRVLEQSAASQRQELMDLRVRELRFRINQHQPRLALLQERLVAAGRVELDALLAQLRDSREALADTPDPVLRQLARGNVDLGERLLAGNERLDRERSTRNEALAESERLATSLRDTRTRLELGGRSEQVGRWLWLERSRLPARHRVQAELAELRGTLAELRVGLVDINEQQRQLADIPAAIVRLQVHGDHGGDDDQAVRASQAELAQVLRQQTELLERLDNLQRRRIAALEQTESPLQAQLADSQALAAMLDRHLLWTPSHSRIDGDWFASAPEGLRDLVKPSRLVTTAGLLGQSVTRRPLVWIGSAVLILLLFAARRRAAVRLDELGQRARQVRIDRFRYTVKASLLTALAATPWAATAWLFGHLLQDVGAVGKYSSSLGLSLALLAQPIYVLDLVRWMMRERGLAHAHFRWARARREAITRMLRQLAPALLIGWYVIVLAFVRNQLLAVDVQARLAIVVVTLVAAWSAWCLLAPGAVWTSRTAEVEPSRPRAAARIAVPAVLAAVALLALAGYVYTSLALAQALAGSAVVVLLVATVSGLLRRWFLLGERRLAMRRLQLRREAEAAANGAGAAAEPVEEEIDLETVNVHTRRLLRAVRISLCVIGLAWVWADVLPAFARLDDITLWHFSQAGSDGARVDVPVSLFAVLLGSILLALTTIASRNLPGLMELGLISHSRIDAASRYAITSLFRYAIVIVGVLAAFSLFGLRWSQLQWMAAALTVGLGFGLQEIFANFVSGIILLFERPFRVGDTITVGGKTGTVTRIRTRATTLRDGEGKEIFIPNKAFITGEVTNWSLTDTTTTIGIEYGVAYDSDIAKVHELALHAARDNVRVLAEPRPSSQFKTFGDSTLNFELRVALGALSDRVPARNEISARLLELFRDAGIDLAFPQMDLHVRSLPTESAGDR